LEENSVHFLSAMSFGFMYDSSLFWWYPLSVFGGMPSRKPPKRLDSAVSGKTSADNKRKKALDFSRAFMHLRTSVYSSEQLIGAEDWTQTCLRTARQPPDMVDNLVQK